MKKVYSLAVLALIVLTLFVVISAYVNAREAEKIKETKEIETVDIVEKKEKIVEQIEYVVALVEEEEKFEEEPKRPKFKNPIPLPEKTLDKIYEISEEYDIPYTLILAIAKVESNFDPKAKSSTSDSGLMQINRKSQQWLADMANLKSVKPTDPIHSVLMATEFLSYLRDYFEKFDISEEDKFYYVVGGYNYGQGGIQRYAKKYDIKNHPYVLKVLKAKVDLERDIIEEAV